MAGMVSLYPHQEEAVNRLNNGKILWGGVGSGKSLTAVTYYVRKESPKDVYVITTAKKRDSLDWERDFAKYGIGKAENASLGGLLHVCSWNDIGKLEGVEGAFFIFDEQRLVGSGAWTRSFIKITRRNTWILLSATPGDSWMDYIPVFIANGYYTNRTQFIREHVVYSPFSKFPKVAGYLNTGRLVWIRNELLVEMPYFKKTKRHTIEIPVEHDTALMEEVTKKRWHVYDSRPLRDAAELFMVMRKVVNSSPSRKQAVISLMQKHPRLIVFYNFDYELAELRSLVESMTDQKSSGHKHPELQESEFEQWKNKLHVNTESLGLESEKINFSHSNPTFTALVAERKKTSRSKKITSTSSITTFGSTDQASNIEKDSSLTTSESSSTRIAEWNGHKHQEIPNSDRWVYLVQYAAGAEGWNCISTDTMVFYSLPYSYKLWHQAHGRIDRLNTTFTDLFYYVLLSNSKIDTLVKRALESKRNFNESAHSKEF